MKTRELLVRPLVDTERLFQHPIRQDEILYIDHMVFPLYDSMPETYEVLEKQVWVDKSSRTIYMKIDGMIVPLSGGGGDCTTCLIGLPSDGSWEDGAADIVPTDTVADAVDKINELLNYLLPTPPDPLDSLTYTPTPVTAFIAQYTNISPLIAGNSHDLIFNVNNVDATTTNSTHFAKADKGQLVLYINGTQVDSFDLEGNFNESERAGAQSYPPATSTNGYITINSVQWYNNFPAYQIGNATIHLTGLAVGSTEVRLEHQVSATETYDVYNVVFYDDGPQPSVDSLSISQASGAPTKYLSGVVYYANGVAFPHSISISNLFDKTYLQQPVTIRSNILTSDLHLDWNTTGSSGYSNPPNYNDPWNYSSDITVDPNLVGQEVNTTVIAADSFGSNSQNYILSQTLFDTYGNASTDLLDLFVDENYRLPDSYNFDSYSSSLTGQWDSTTLLTNGQAQVLAGSLVYPSIDFTSGWNPTPQTADYSGFTGDQVYYRGFYSSAAHNSGTIRLRGLVWADVGSNVKLEMKLPTQTGWLDLSQPFNAGTFTGTDGDGCMTSYSQSGSDLLISWSSGTFSTANSGYRYYLRITFLNGSKEISELEETGW